MTDTAAADPAREQADGVFGWGHDGLRVELSTDPDGVTRLVRLERPGDTGSGTEPAARLPLVELTALGHGTGWSGPRFTGTAPGGRMRTRAVRSRTADGWHFLDLELHDPVTGLTASVELSSPDGVPVLRSRTRVRNDNPHRMVLQSVSSLLLGGLPPADTLEVHRARNDWLGEGRWYAEPLRATVADIGVDAHQHDSRAGLTVAGRGSWPTDGHLAAGALGDRRGGRAWAWQIESPAGWRWDIGEYGHGCHLALHGPTDADHQWRHALGPGQEFTTVPVAVALGTGFEDAIAALTSYRRTIRRPHPDHTALPVVFNDYMNTLMGDPTTQKLLPLIDAAAQAGAEYFCVDSGWYDDDLHGWWDSVGEWLPSSARFPGGGIQAVFDRIRSRGMVPGLWLEPEVVGVRSRLARTLPDDAFFQHDGIRLTEQGRHQLDLRHPAARAHLDATVDRIVGEWGVGYLKLDYNIVIAPGTQGPADTSPGAGLLGHARAYLDWITAVLDRHPGLVVENCASGGMRMDGATLAVTQLQSTSDQQDPLRYPPIAAAAPAAVPPEQSAVWAYPQPEFTDDEIAFTLAGALLGRVHLSGRLDRMTPDQLSLVRQALTVYKDLRADLPRALPFWPLGLPGWTDPWLAQGMRVPGGPTYLLVWHREGDRAAMSLPVPHLADRPGVRVQVLHPGPSAGEAAWAAAEGVVEVRLPRTPTALLLRLDTVS
ncbi:glycoside hydrolase family 36 protein [Streptomyces sp. NRRL F-5123]|uniref:glycoside hydrolase family 36 protein n=1 Tax=Streptomyces sp. NRRL F-5123 TaxID=1463856 RepID=UPI0004E0E9DC|nr:glycoside hydrolase family 36 protein [Streptomyces sp. NRRL F-5123]